MPRIKRRQRIEREGRYTLVYDPYHKRSNKSGYVYEHIKIAENALGRDIDRSTPIHHYGEKHDNTKLVICDSHKYHKLLHRNMKGLGIQPKNKIVPLIKEEKKEAGLAKMQHLMDRNYLKAFMVGTGKKLGDIAAEIGTNPSWLSSIFNGDPISMAMARSIAMWVKDHGGDISVEKLMISNRGSK